MTRVAPSSVANRRTIQPDGPRAPSPAAGVKRAGNDARKLVVSYVLDYGIVVAVVAMIVVLSFTANNFLTIRNFLNIFDQNSPLMLVALGTTCVLLTGCFDLSSGHILSLGGVLGAKLALTTGDPALGIILAILFGAPIGIANGLLVGKLRVNSFLGTLATGLVLSGVALTVTRGTSFDLSSNDGFRWLGNHRISTVPITVIVLVIVYAVLAGIVNRTVFGRYIYAVGSNEEAARLSGISVAKVRTVCYVIGALTAALGGLIIVSRTGVGTVYGSANSLTLNAIAAVVIGGTSISGGRGALWRTVLGVTLLALIQNAFNLLSVPPYWQQIVSGTIIIAAVVLNTLAERR